MKEKIIHFFKHDRSYGGGVKLFNEFGTLISLKKQLNVQDENQNLRETLFEALRELAGIPIAEFNGLMLTPVKPVGDPRGNPHAPAETKPASANPKATKPSNKPKAPSKGKKPAKPASTKKVTKSPKPPKRSKPGIKVDPPKETPEETPPVVPQTPTASPQEQK